MSDHSRPHSLRAPLIGAGVLIGVSLALAASAQLTGVGAWRVSLAEPLETISLNFADRPDGAVEVFDAVTGLKVWTYDSGKHGFVRSVLRAVAHERKVSGLATDAPFELTRHADGNLSIVDPVTGARVIVNCFGKPNAAEIALLFDRSAG